MKYTFKDICTKIGSGATPTGGKEAYKGGDYALVRSQNVLDYTFTTSGLAYINETQAKKLDGVKVEAGDVLLNITGDSVARACIIPDEILPARVNQHVAIIRANNQYALNEYLLYFLQYNKQYLLSISQGGGTRSAITKKMIEDIEIDLPSIEDQLAIVNIINSISKKIEVNQQINDNLEQQASFLFQDWLSNCNSNVSIRELAENVLDYTQNKCEQVYLLNSSDVTEGRFSSLPLVSNTNLKGQFKKRFKKGDILYSEIRPRNRHYAYCYFDADRYIASTRLIILRAKPDMLTSSTVLYQYLMLNSVFEEFTLKTESRSGTFPQGNYEDLSSIRVPYSANQEEIAKSLEAIYEQLWNNLKENERLEALRDSLLPKLMSGELKINNLDC